MITYINLKKIKISYKLELREYSVIKMDVINKAISFARSTVVYWLLY